jgi:hypothetical protein
VKCRIPWCTTNVARHTWCRCHLSKEDSAIKSGDSSRWLRDYADSWQDEDFHTCDFWHRKLSQHRQVNGKQIPEPKLEFVYLIESQDSYKIGHSEDPWKRKSELQTGNPSLLKLVSVVEGGKDLERELHGMFSKYRIHGEWFSGGCELLDWFAVDTTKFRILDIPGAWIFLNQDNAARRISKIKEFCLGVEREFGL